MLRYYPLCYLLFNASFTFLHIPFCVYFFSLLLTDSEALDRSIIYFFCFGANFNIVIMFSVLPSRCWWFLRFLILILFSHCNTFLFPNFMQYRILMPEICLYFFICAWQRFLLVHFCVRSLVYRGFESDEWVPKASSCHILIIPSYHLIFRLLCTHPSYYFHHVKDKRKRKKKLRNKKIGIF